MVAPLCGLETQAEWKEVWAATLISGSWLQMQRDQPPHTPAAWQAADATWPAASHPCCMTGCRCNVTSRLTSLLHDYAHKLWTRIHPSSLSSFHQVYCHRSKTVNTPICQENHCLSCWCTSQFPGQIPLQALPIAHEKSLVNPNDLGARFSQAIWVLCLSVCWLDLEMKMNLSVVLNR